MHTLRLESHIGLLHDAQFSVGAKHLGPLFHAFEDLALDLLVYGLPFVSIAFARQPMFHSLYRWQASRVHL